MKKISLLLLIVITTLINCSHSTNNIVLEVHFNNNKVDTLSKRAYTYFLRDESLYFEDGLGTTTKVANNVNYVKQINHKK